MKRLNPFWIIRKGLTFMVAASVLLSASVSEAGPAGGVVTGGNATITQTTETTTINQYSQNAAINWQSFNINSGETVNFNQPNVQSITLNRVVGNEGSVIDGALNANGQVFLLNSNGVLFGKNASINTSGLVATTMSLSDEDFMAENYSFSDASDASIINMGTISIADAGYAALLGSDVQNSGKISAVKGKIYMTGADSATINLNGNSLVSLTVDKSTVDSLVQNSGAVIANGGDIYLTTSSAEDLVAGVVNNTGLVQAESIGDLTGNVIIYAHGGAAEIGGTITTGSGEGFVETSGANMTIAEGASVTTGHWLIDPTDITIDSAAADTLESQLSSGDASLEADETITVDADIDVDANTLTLTAGTDITVNSTINVNNSAEIDFEYGGDLTVTLDSGTVNLNDSSTLTINSTAYTVIRDYAGWSAMNSGLSGSYALGADLDLTGESYTVIGTSGSKFTGTFNGLGHTVSNLNINTADSEVGLFGYAYNANLSNLLVTNASVITSGTSAGILAGYIEGTSVSNVGVSGDVEGSMFIGGLIGDMEAGSSVTGSYSSGTSTGTSTSGIAPVGGLIGWIYSEAADVSVSDSYSSATVSGLADQAGGLIGYAQYTTITDSYATGDVSSDRFVGGLVGGMGGQSSVSGSYATGAIVATGAFAGGLIGKLYEANSLTNSYATGNVTGGGNYTGGLLGSVDTSTVTNTYATGNVTSTASAVGGLIGGTQGSTSNISGSYATGTVSGVSYVGGLFGILSASSALSDSYSAGNVTGTGNYTGGLTGYTSSSTSITDSYTNGDVDGNDYVGSLTGYLNGGTITNSYALGAVSGSSNVGGLLYYNSGTVTDSYFSSDTNPAMAEDTYNVAATESEILIAVHDNWDSGTWTDANTNMGVPLLQWQNITEISLDTDGTYTYGTGYGASDFLSDVADYSDYSYIVTDASDNDVTAYAEAGTLGAGTYTVSLLVKGEYNVTNNGSSFTIDKKNLDYSINADSITYGDIFTTSINYSGTVSGGTDITGTTTYTVLDASNNDVTIQAEAGTLGAGTYTVATTLTDDNYTASGSTTTFTIGKKELSYTLSSDTMTYGDTFSITAEYTGTIADISGSTEFTVYDANNNDVTADAEAGTLGAGIYTVGTTLTDNNYTASGSTTTFTVNKKTLSYTLSPSTLMYGTELDSVSISYEGNPDDISGTLTYTVLDLYGNDVTADAEAGKLKEGTYTITASLTDNNYLLSETEYQMVVKANEKFDEVASITPAIFNNIAIQPSIPVGGGSEIGDSFGGGTSSLDRFSESLGDDTGASSGEQTGGSAAGASGDTGGSSGSDGEGGSTGYVDAGSGFANSYSGLVEIINGGISVPE